MAVSVGHMPVERRRVGSGKVKGLNLEGGGNEATETDRQTDIDEFLPNGPAARRRDKVCVVSSGVLDGSIFRMMSEFTGRRISRRKIHEPDDRLFRWRSDLREGGDFGFFMRTLSAHRTSLRPVVGVRGCGHGGRRLPIAS